jgi:RNA polymerase sigma-70 factor (ECF subfamily)
MTWQRAMDQATESELVRLTRQGELEAYGELVRRHQDGVFNACYRVLGNWHEAEDMAQETFVRGFERLDRYDINRPFGPWIRKVGVNLSLNRLAHLRSTYPPALELEDEHDLAPGQEMDPPHTASEKSETAAALRQAILDLPAHYRAVIELRHFQEMSYQEMASQLAIPVSDVKSHLFRARRAIARRLMDG